MKYILKYLIVILFITINITCRNETKAKEVNTNLNTTDTLKSHKNIKSLTCSDVIQEIIKSSDLNLKDYKNYFIRIEKIKEDSITLQVYFENNLSDNPKERQIVQSTIAWLLFLPNEQQLLNTTSDPENPVKVNYTFTDFNQLYKTCNISKKKKPGITKIDEISDIDCKTISVEMGKGEECILKNTTIENVYNNLIKDGEVDDCKYLLKIIPKNNQNVKINRDGLINVEYNVEKNKNKIIFNYDGGITEVSIQKLSNENNIKRSIIYYAD